MIQTHSDFNNFKSEICLFCATNTVKNSDKNKYVYSGYDIAFDGADSRSFINNFAGNIIFGIDNNSPSPGDNWKNNFRSIRRRTKKWY